MITPMNRLPVIIDAPGEYKTRNGATAYIFEIKPHGDLSTTAFTAKGHYVKPGLTPSGRPRKRQYTIWHVSGRHSAILKQALDIVEKVQP